MLPDDHEIKFNFDYEILDTGGLDIEVLTTEEFELKLLDILQQYLGVELGTN